MNIVIEGFQMVKSLVSIFIAFLILPIKVLKMCKDCNLKLKTLDLEVKQTYPTSKAPINVSTYPIGDVKRKGCNCETKRKDTTFWMCPFHGPANSLMKNNQRR